MYFTTTQVSAITGVPTKTLDEWCRSEAVLPLNNRLGYGTSRRWTLMQIVAAYHVNALRQVPMFHPKTIPSMLEYISNLSEEDLVENIREDRTIVFPMKDGWGLTDLPKSRPEDATTDKQRQLFIAWNIDHSYFAVKAKVNDLIQSATTVNGRA